MISKIHDCFKSNSVLYTNHAKTEMRAEEFGIIKEYEVFESICSGEVIEEYPDDTPYPSILIYGNTKETRPLHAVCAYDEPDRVAIVITVYQPDPKLWINFKRRIKK